MTDNNLTILVSFNMAKMICAEDSLYCKSVMYTMNPFLLAMPMIYTIYYLQIQGTAVDTHVAPS